MVAITELTPKALLRARGEEAFRAVTPYFALSDKVLVDIPIDSLVSLSFLDEFAIRLNQAGLLGRVIFSTTDGAILDKLATVAGTRGIEISFTQDEEHNVIQTVAPNLPSDQDATIAEEKPSSMSDEGDTHP